MPIERLNPENLFNIPGYSHVVVATGKKFVHIGGQTAYDKSFKLIGEDDYFLQMVTALRHLRIAVEAAGGEVHHIVSSTVFIKNINDHATEAFFKAMAMALGDDNFPPHAFSLIGVQGLSGEKTLVEISAVAIID